MGNEGTDGCLDGPGNGGQLYLLQVITKESDFAEQSVLLP